MHGRVSRTRLRTWILLAACLAVLAGTLVYAQNGNFTPLDPVTLSPQTVGIQYVWGAAVYGVGFTHIEGNYTVYGNTLLLNRILNSSPATVWYNISFISLKDISGHANNFALYLPTQLSLTSNSTPINVSVGGNHFLYYATDPTHPFWYYYGNPAHPVYVPELNLSQYPGPYRLPGNPPFIQFNFTSSTLAQNSTVSIEITVPADGQFYINDIIFTASFDAASGVTPAARTVGLLSLPLLGLGLAGVFWVLKRFSASRFAGTLAAAFSLQVVLSLFFLHTDLVTFIRYDALYYNYGIVNLQTWTYGLVWLGSILIPPAPVLAAGVTPSIPLWTVLLKLPAIIANLLTFLVLVRILTPHLGERRAYAIAAFGWLFNPLVVFISAVHGLDESVIALLVAITAYFLLNRRFWLGTASTVAAVLTILPAACIAVPTFFSRRTSWPQRILLLAAPVVAYVLAFLALYHSPSGLDSYLLNLVRRTNFENLQLGASNRSPMTYLFLLDSWFGLYLSPALGAVLLVAACFIFALRGTELLPSHAVLALYGSLLAFYFTYEVFYVQHLLWALPLFAVLVALVPGVRSLYVGAFVVGVSVLAVAIDLLTSPHPALAAPLSWVLFAWLTVPVLLWVPRRISRSVPAGVVHLGARILGAGFGFSLAVDAVSSHAIPIDLSVAGAVAGVAFVVLAALPSGLPPRLLQLSTGAGTAVAIVGSLLVAYGATSAMPPADLVATWGLVTMAMAELALLTTEALRSSEPALSEAPGDASPSPS